MQLRVGLLVLASVMLAACGGGSSSAILVTPSATPVPTPTPTAVPGVLTAHPTSLSFLTTGASAAQMVLVQEGNFSGTLSETDTCSGIVSLNPTQSVSPYTATVTPTAAGTCAINFSDGTMTVPVAVTVTTSGVTINAKGNR